MAPIISLFLCYFNEIGNYTVVKKLRLRGVEDAISAYTDFVNDPANGCVSPITIVSDCNGPVYNVENGFPLTNGENCDMLLDILKGDLSPGGQYFDNLYLGESDPGIINNWLKGLDSGGSSFAGPNVLDPDKDPVTLSSFDELKNILLAEGISVNIWTIDDGWNTFRQYWNIEAVQEHLLGYDAGEWAIYRYHPEYPHYRWCLNTKDLASGNGDFDADLLDYSTVPSSWISNLQGPCPSGSSFYQIMDADPYFSGSMGIRRVNGNGLDGKELMRALICDYPEEPTQGNSMWEAAEVAADQANGGSATTQEIWEVFANFYLQQKGRVMNLQRKNPCDVKFYSPFLYDEATTDTPADMVADLPRDHAFYLWGPSAYELGGNSNPSSGLHPIYNNWEQSCDVQNSLIPDQQALLDNWTYTDDNKQLRVTDVRSEGYQIRVPDMEQAAQDLVDDGANDGIFGQNDNWDDLEDMMELYDPCAQGAAAMIPYGTLNTVPMTGTAIAQELAKRLYYWDSASPRPTCQTVNSNPNTCLSLVSSSIQYYSYEDFYYANEDFFDCLVDAVNNHSSGSWNFMATHTPTHLIISSPDNYMDIPDGTYITTYSNCNCNPAAAGQSSDRSVESDSDVEVLGVVNGDTQRSTSSRTIGGCYPFYNPCNQIIPHCLCEDFYEAYDLAGGNINSAGGYYSSEYWGSPTAWTNFLITLQQNCTNYIYNPNATEQQIIDAIAEIEDLADGVVDLPSSPNTPAPVLLDCYDLEPDPCEEGQLIADYYEGEAYQDQINALIADFAANYAAHCMSPTDAPDALRMSYEDREYHFTLYYRTPDGNLYATVPP